MALHLRCVHRPDHRTGVLMSVDGGNRNWPAQIWNGALDPERTLRSDPRNGPNLKDGGTAPQLLHGHIVWRVPELMDGLHRRKLKQRYSTLIGPTFKKFNRSSSDMLSAKSLNKRNNRSTVPSVLFLIRNCALYDHISRHCSLTIYRRTATHNGPVSPRFLSTPCSSRRGARRRP